MSGIKLYYDLETTGVKHWKNSIHQIAGILEGPDGQILETFDLRVQPHPKATVEPEALKIAGVTEQDLAGYMPMKDGHRYLVKLLSKYIDRFDRRDKAHLVGYNNAGFDDKFLRAWFTHCGDPYFGSWFWPVPIDVYVLAGQHLINEAPKLPDFKLVSVANYLGIEADKDKAHDALYDVGITRQIYKHITGGNAAGTLDDLLA